MNKVNVDSSYFDVNGVRIYYEIHGSGESLVLLHGSMVDHRHWQPQIMPFSKHYKVISYDLRGYGKSDTPDPDKPYLHCDDLKTLLEYLDISARTRGLKSSLINHNSFTEYSK